MVRIPYVTILGQVEEQTYCDTKQPLDNVDYIA
ncbi:hypothetical protein EYZ11_009923 [Aspergillus tanneri]|uniref:Uncharacterized protein n=1 Tax=Aspergillus tanneri TaxID=1220188 RepID=A0A4S3J8R6_9EURO|nr:hypothetical protein EYZ11_009923 [Aspergillus tanneri]